MDGQDGNYVEPFETSHVLINAGERYGVLLHTSADHPRESWIMLETRYRKLVAGYGVLAMSGPLLARRAVSPSHEPPAHPGRWSDKATQLEDQFRALEASGASDAVAGPIKDEVRAQAVCQSIDSCFYRGFISSGPWNPCKGWTAWLPNSPPLRVVCFFVVSCLLGLLAAGPGGHGMGQASQGPQVQPFGKPFGSGQPLLQVYGYTMQDE